MPRSIIVLFWSLLTTVLLTSSSYADVIETPEDSLRMDRNLSMDAANTARYLSKNHYLPIHLDDSLSTNILDTYLEKLDSNKLYFTQEDVNNFEKYRYELDDAIKSGNVNVAFEIFKVFRKRVEQRSQEAEQLLKSDFDFTKDEYITIDKDELEWVKEGEQMHDRWRKHVKNDVLTQTLNQKPMTEVITNLTRRYQRQRDTMFQLKPDEVFELFMNSYTKEIEPHTQYMSNFTMQDFEINMSLSLEGIGAMLTTDVDTGNVKIMRVLPGSPADKTNLLTAEDGIVEVQQDGEEPVNIVAWRLTDVVKIIRGKKGSKVTLHVLKAGALPGSKLKAVDIVRDVIKLEDQAAKLSQYDLPQDEVCSVIRIPLFYSNASSAKSKSELASTSSDVKKLLMQIKNSNSRGLVIDLRDNGGGYLTEAIDLTGLFIPKGPVVQVIDTSKRRQVLEDTNPSQDYKGPLIVLVNRYSASASEIFAAALKDYGKAIIVGERTFGKGTVQNLVPLHPNTKNGYKSQIKFTNAQFFRINGGSTQFKGVTPDITLYDGIEDEDFGERAYDNALPWSETQKAHYSSHQISQDLVKSLTQKHIIRAKKTPAFTYLRQRSETYQRYKDIKQYPLNSVKRKDEIRSVEQQSINHLNAYRKTLDLEPVTIENQAEHPLPDIETHWHQQYHKEACNIMGDLLNQQEATATLLTAQQ